MRIFFIGGHELGAITLEYLVNKGKNICGVAVSDNQDSWYSGVDEVAKKYSLELFKEKDINNNLFLEKLKKMDIDIIVIVNFEQILSEDLIDIPNKGCINTHASLLPKYKGRAPLNWAIINGEREAGVTVHYVEKEVDSGSIIIQKKFEIEKDDYIGDILEKVKKIYPAIVGKAIELIYKGKESIEMQDREKGFYCKKRTPEDGFINWNSSSEEIYNLIRAVSKPYPGARTKLGGKDIIIWRAKLADQLYEHKNKKDGSVIENSDFKILFKSNPKNILVEEFEYI